MTSRKYSLTNTIRVIKSIKMRWAGLEARVGERCRKGFGGEMLGKKTIWKTWA